MKRYLARRMDGGEYRNMAEIEAPQLRVPFGSRLTILDAVRGAAVLMVLTFHSAGVRVAGPVTSLWAGIVGSLWSGVDLFFVLSGFLITGILLDSRRHPRYFVNFYTRRALRIFPLYYGVLIVVLLIAPVVWPAIRAVEYWRTLQAHQLWLLVYLHNYLQAQGSHELPGLGHFWTLAIEEQFYWVWPLVVYYIAPRRLLKMSVLLCAFAPAVRILLYFNGVSPWAIRQLTFTRIDSLAWGGIVALLLREPGLAHSGRRWIRRLGISGGVGLLVIFVGMGSLPFEAPVMVTIGYSMVAAVFAAFLAACSFRKSPTPRPGWPQRGLAWIGTISYGIYVFHWPTYQLLEGVRSRYLSNTWLAVPGIPQAMATLAGTLALSTGIAFLSWRFWERPFLRLKSRFAYVKTAEGAGRVQQPAGLPLSEG